MIPVEEKLQGRYVALAGVELEGGWDEWPENDRIDIGSDGSVRADAPHVGEIRTAPLPPGQMLRLVPEIYPDEVNKTCGLHLHMSFRSLVSYGALCEDEFWPFLSGRLEVWGERANIKNPEFWARLRGENNYCSNSCKGPYRRQQTRATDRGDVRYAPVNYCWGLHKTVEVRVLPMFKRPEVAVTALRQVLNATDEWIHDRRVIRRTTRPILHTRAELEVE